MTARPIPNRKTAPRTTAPDVTERPEAPADPVASEDGVYIAVVSEYRGLRRAGGGFLPACVITAAHLYLAQENSDRPPVP